MQSLDRTPCVARHALRYDGDRDSAARAREPAAPPRATRGAGATAYERPPASPLECSPGRLANELFGTSTI